MFDSIDYAKQIVLSGPYNGFKYTKDINKVLAGLYRKYEYINPKLAATIRMFFTMELPVETVFIYTDIPENAVHNSDFDFRVYRVEYYGAYSLNRIDYNGSHGIQLTETDEVLRAFKLYYGNSDTPVKYRSKELNTLASTSRYLETKFCSDTGDCLITSCDVKMSSESVANTNLCILPDPTVEKPEMRYCYAQQGIEQYLDHCKMGLRDVECLFGKYFFDYELSASHIEAINSQYAIRICGNCGKYFPVSLTPSSSQTVCYDCSVDRKDV